MPHATVADALREFLALIELLDDAYWEAGSIRHKDSLYDVISIFTTEVLELGRLSSDDHHFPYEIITEGVRRVVPRLESLDATRDEVIPRTQTLTDFRDIVSSVLSILEEQLVG